MASRTRLLEAVRDARASVVAALLRETPDLLVWRDERGRNLLHVCCGVNAGKTAVMLLARKRDPRLRRVAETLAT